MTLKPLLNRIFIVLGLYGAMACSHAQVTDSLSVSNLPDTTQLNNLRSLAAQTINPKKSLAYLLKAKEISEKLNDPTLMVEVLFLIAKTERQNTLDDFGKAEIDHALSLNQYLQDTITGIRLTLEKARYHDDLDQLDKAISVAQEALVMAKAISDSIMMARIFNRIGLSLQSQNRWGEAFTYFQSAMDIASNLGDERLMNTISNSYGLVYLGQGKYQKALQSFEKSVNHLEEGLDDEKLAKGFGNIAICFFELGDFYSDSANLGGQYYDSAIFYAEASIKLKKKVKKYASITYPAQTLAKTYGSLGNFEKAKEYAEMSLEAAKKGKATRNLMESYRLLALSDYYSGAYKSAAEYWRKAYDFSHSLFEEQLTATITEMEVKYQTSQKESENNLLKKDQLIQRATIERQKFYIIASALLGMLLLVFALIFFGLYQRRKQDSQRIASQNKLLENQSNKLVQLDQFKSRFFANVSHDLRSPITLIKGNLEVLRKEDNYLTEKAGRALKNAEKNVSQLGLLTSEINDLTLLENKRLKLSYASIRIASLVKVITGMFVSLAESKGIALNHLREIPEDKTIKADPQKIEKVLNNLIDNALKHTREGGKVKVTVKEAAHGVGIEVADTGEGIEEVHLPYVFDRFYQSPGKEHKTKEGLGIGLALVKELVELHGGEITVRSKVKQGSTFYFTLPDNIDKEEILKGPPLDISHQPVSQPDYDTQATALLNPLRKAATYTILLVDDHQEIREYIAGVIDPAYQVIEAGNGDQAIKILERQKIDLIITDLMMPLMDGFELIETIKNNNRLTHIDILVLTARDTAEDKEKVLFKGVNNFLSKPFDAKELNMRISNMIHRSIPDTFSQLADKKGQRSAVEENLVGKLNQLILDRIDDPKLSIADLADLLHTSERNVHRVIKSLVKETPKAYIRKIRLDYAEWLLKTRRVKSVAEASRAVGMPNTTSFVKQFSEIKRKSPKELL